MTVNKLTLPAKENAVQNKINEIIDNLGGGGGGITDVEVNNTSVVSGGVANIDLTGYAQKSGAVFTGNVYATNVYQQSSITPNAYVQSLTAETVDTYSANKTLSNISSTSSPNFDGQWVNSEYLIRNTVSYNTFTADLSSYLPNDNYSYEVLVSFECSHSGSSGGGNVVLVENETIPTVHTVANSTLSNNTRIVPVGTSHSFSHTVRGKNMSAIKIYAVGYRRIGTNT